MLFLQALGTLPTWAFGTDTDFLHEWHFTRIISSKLPKSDEEELRKLRTIWEMIKAEKNK